MSPEKLTPATLLMCAGGDASVPIDPLVAQQQNTMKVSGRN
jgi:hypothetical protein